MGGPDMTQFELLPILDSPLLQSLAPELIPFRDRVLTAHETLKTASCTACQRRHVLLELTIIELELKALLETNQALNDTIPTLKASLGQDTP
jgi:hypothetical protein